jgi:hypothetical protein
MQESIPEERCKFVKRSFCATYMTGNNELISRRDLQGGKPTSDIQNDFKSLKQQKFKTLIQKQPLVEQNRNIDQPKVDKKEVYILKCAGNGWFLNVV